MDGSWPQLEDCTSEIYSPEETDGMTGWQVFVSDCKRFWEWIIT